jgi:hypothetical protein
MGGLLGANVTARGEELVRYRSFNGMRIALVAASPTEIESIQAGTAMLAATCITAKPFNYAAAGATIKDAAASFIVAGLGVYCADGREYLLVRKGGGPACGYSNF